ncbi:MAG: asparaginase [Chloroflexota bacterium]
MTLPRVAGITTGGTIDSLGADRLDLAAYLETGRRLEPGELLDSVAPELATIARVTEAPYERVAAHAMTDAYLAGLADLVRTLLGRGDTDGIVITHGTNTLEETAWLLHLAVTTDAPVVLTGAMRPASALSGDGPLNLVSAVRVAGSATARGLGVLVVMDDTIHGARDVTKTNTLRVDAFSSPMTGPIGRVDGDGRVVISSLPARATTLRGAYAAVDLRSLHRVDVVASYQGADGALIDAAVAAGAKGIVSAATGDGYPTPWQVEALERASKAGVAIVQSTRVGSGRVPPLPAVTARGWIAADDLVPWKARTLLRLALAAGEDLDTIRARFAAD